MVDCYDFEALDSGALVARVRNVALASFDAAWPHVAELAPLLRSARGRIKVTNSKGEIVVLIGAASAKKLLTSHHVRQSTA